MINANAYIYELSNNHFVKKEEIIIDDFSFDLSTYFENSMEGANYTVGNNTVYMLGILPEIEIFEMGQIPVCKTKPEIPVMSIFKAQVSGNGFITYTKLYEGDYDDATISKYKNI